MKKQSKKVKNVVVAGKSGAGKQPRIDVLVEEFGLVPLSTGNMFRHYLTLFDSIGYTISLDEFWSEETKDFVPDHLIKERLDRYLNESGKKGMNHPTLEELILGLKAKYFVEKGLFGPDNLVNKLFKTEFAKRDYRNTVFDGYPRTLKQADYLLNLVDEVKTRIDFVLVVDNDDELIIKRTIGRRICPRCGKVYHIEHNPPGEGGVCKVCGVPVIQRSDDSEEKIKRRLEEFRRKCVPALEYLKERGIPVVHVPGNIEPFTKENVRKSVLDAISKVVDI